MVSQIQVEVKYIEKWLDLKSTFKNKPNSISSWVWGEKGGIDDNFYVSSLGNYVVVVACIEVNCII